MWRSTEDGWMAPSSSGSMMIRPAASSSRMVRSERIMIAPHATAAGRMAEDSSYRIGAEARRWVRYRAGRPWWSFVYHTEPKGICHARRKSDGSVACGATQRLYPFGVRWDEAGDLERCPACVDAVARNA